MHRYLFCLYYIIGSKVYLFICMTLSIAMDINTCDLKRILLTPPAPCPFRSATLLQWGISTSARRLACKIMFNGQPIFCSMNKTTLGVIANIYTALVRVLLYEDRSTLLSKLYLHLPLTGFSVKNTTTLLYLCSRF